MCTKYSAPGYVSQKGVCAIDLPKLSSVLFCIPKRSEIRILGGPEFFGNFLAAFWPLFLQKWPKIGQISANNLGPGSIAEISYFEAINPFKSI